MGTGMRIKEAAKEKGITLKKLAESANISYNTLYSITKRDSERVDPETVRRIAAVLDIEPWKLMGFDGSVRVHVPQGQREYLDLMMKLFNKTITSEEFQRLNELKSLIAPLEKNNGPDNKRQCSEVEIPPELNLEETQKYNSRLAQLALEASEKISELNRELALVMEDIIKLPEYQPAAQDTPEPQEGKDTTPPPEGAEGTGEGE